MEHGDSAQTKLFHQAFSLPDTKLGRNFAFYNFGRSGVIGR